MGPNSILELMKWNVNLDYLALYGCLLLLFSHPTVTISYTIVISSKSLVTCSMRHKGFGSDEVHTLVKLANVAPTYLVLRGVRLSEPLIML